MNVVNHYKNSLNHNKLLLTQNSLDASTKLFNNSEMNKDDRWANTEKECHIKYSVYLCIRELKVLTWELKDSDFGYNFDTDPQQQCKAPQSSKQKAYEVGNVSQ